MARRNSNFVKRYIYVEHVTAARSTAEARRCQGLHNPTFLSYGSPPWSDLAAACLSIASIEASKLLPPRREDECREC